jgi:two-component system response regulator NreC
VYSSKVESNRIESVVVVDDDFDMRRILCNLCETVPLRVCGDAADGGQALALIRQKKPDLVLIDPKLPHISGIDVIATIRGEMPHVRFMAITAEPPSLFFARAVEAGALAYLQKPDFIFEFKPAVKRVLNGQAYITPEISDTLIHRYFLKSRDLESRLTPRQREVTYLLSEGLTNSEMADVMHLSVRTVEKHRADAMGRLGARNAAELVRYAAAGERNERAT